MSIPPLVCSTPPPPDQCEDDKDTEDYDLQYHLSQDDEDDNYDFGNFSSFNHFQSSQSKTDPVITTVAETLKKNDSSTHKGRSENVLGANGVNEGKAEIIEENHVEDLDLKLDDTLQKDDDSKQNHVELKSQENVYKISKSDLTSPVELESTLQSDEFVEPLSLEEPLSYVDEIIAAVDNCDMTPTVPELPSDFSEEVEPNDELSIPESQEIETETLKSEIQIPKQDTDDFGDFDDFQFATLEKPDTIDICDNPWENSNKTNDDFGDFKASFEEGESNLFSANKLATDHSTETSKSEAILENVESASRESIEDDDFGEFDDFKSSGMEAQTSGNADDDDEEPIPQFPLLNLQGTDEQIMEYINNVINSQFENDTEEPAKEFDEKLESVLGVTWGHILAVDERQPYVVNWNNSLAQKTLLKALCIDSRNILFGPKWNYSMPKYAATLSAAPLQPQKQVTSPTQAEPSTQEKTTSKSGTWSDPFTSDGKESSKLEPSSQNPVIEPRPTDLDVFEASTSSKPDKIFSSTLSVQPIRQISLPDTHIFTPTDSETPRSTTIHYDNTPTVLLPQTVIDSKRDPSFKPEQTLSPRPSTSTADDDYWEFQDYKGPASNTTIPPTSMATKQPELLKTKSNVTYATQVLQPIKVEPIMPTLNWPDPGEVKETFDDFSDFVSSTTLSSQSTPIVPVTHIDHKPLPDCPAPSSSVALKTNERISAGTGGDFDDDFDTFQSALPAVKSSSTSSSCVSGVSNATVGGTIPGTSLQTAPSPNADFEFAFPKVNNVKSEPISLETMTNPKDTSQTQTNFFPNNLEFKSLPLQTPSAQMATGLLQPMPANSSTTLQDQQKLGQILQPLSLESFSQINWPNPGIDLQDLSRFNPVETLHSFKSDLSVNSQSKIASPVHGQKSAASSQSADDDWGEFVSSKPKPQPQQATKGPTSATQAFAADDDEWTDFVSSPSVKPQNGVNTISFNVHTNTNLTIQKPNPGKFTKKRQPLDIPTLNYITPKSTNHKIYNDRHLNL